MTNLENRIKKLEEISKKLNKYEKPKYPFLDTLFVFLDHLETATLITDCDDNIIHANKGLLDYLDTLDIKLDLDSNVSWWKQFGWECNPSTKNLITQECIDKKRVVSHDVPSRLVDGLVYKVMCIPLKYNGVAAVLSIILINDV